MNVAVARGQFLPEEEQLGDFVQVGLFIEDGSPVLEGLQLISVGRCLRIQITSASGETVRPIAVRDVVGPSTEGVDGAHGQSLLFGEVLERMIEVASLAHGQFLAVAVGQLMQFGRWLLRPDRCVKVSERVNQFVGLANNSDEGSTFTKGLHGGDTDGLHGVSGKGHTCP